MKIRMDCYSVQHTFFFILLALLVGQGDGRWKKSSREMLQHDIKLFKKITERLKEELGSYYEEMSDEPFADYFLEEIDYLQSRIDNDIKRKAKSERRKEINYSHAESLNNNNQILQQYTRNKQASLNNVTLESNNRKNDWPSFQEILKEMGKKYDWKNDRWIKVKNKDKDKQKPADSKNNVEHIKHNFKYRIVKLNRAKSKRNIVVAVTAVR